MFNKFKKESFSLLFGTDLEVIVFVENNHFTNAP